ncbi:inactive hydroxysteroid dehydrogenase-like protein 1-like [Stylonychia lemnae]|uniref:Inactive hydroxysteroid dehydrogenase-like protein 1-like n=1 Tax=Stylonychia lemnae TaxID=5949 RepID=A0A077ZRF6_STYLE|nr:inactive hydroxysteroid dehydrogenase-like protein 1-like [Stylonychia lemnae]|eukprot:CDW72477.1 inactive hydroxysteroid dehydrogenase-like protein 1-like [Stylonychia lemnae]
MKELGCFDYFAIFLGVYVLVPKLYQIWMIIYTSFIVQKKDLKVLYGADSWALITGCTSGIGEELAHRIAQQGLNIILISRSLDKLTKVENDILKKCPQIKTLKVIADYANGGETLEFYKKIYAQIKDLDISIVVNNAGILYSEYYRQLNISQIMEMAIVNTYPYILFNHLILKKLQQRSLKKQTALLNVSSSISFVAGPYQQIYGCTKKFERYFTEALRQENKKEYPNLEVICVTPMYVSTQMTNNLSTKEFGVVNAEQYVEGVLKVFGNLNHIFGPMIHQVQGYFTNIFFELSHYYRLSLHIVNHIIYNECQKMK